MSILHGYHLHPAGLFRAGCFFFLTCLFAASTHLHAAPQGVVVHPLHPLNYEDARAALLDAIVDEGIAPPAVSQFGDMLARTAPDLGHRPDSFEHAEIFSFCSARISARLIAEDVRNIALCPLTIALYTVPAKPGTVFLAYRPPAATGAGGRMARDLLRRLVTRIRENTGLR